jgi:ferritin-like metal-binding protein YciE
MAAIRTLEDLLLHELKDLYDAENQLTKALPMMAQAASNRELKAGFEEHLRQTEGHIRRLEQVFQAMGQRASGETCLAMQGLIQEGNKTLQEDMEQTVRDAALIAAAQRIEHYEMAGYGTARTFAYVLGNQEAAQLLQQTLDEEEQTDKRLTMLANRINEKAM